VSRRLLAHVALNGAALVIVLAALANVAGISRLTQILRPATNAAGIEQDWRVFAPNPRQFGIRLELVVERSDGTREVWAPPHEGRLFGGYRDYRWRKWMERASADRFAALLLPPAARYVTRRFREEAGTRLRVIRYTRPLAPPGVTQPVRWTATELYRAELTASEP
jgi:hypothetical protein